MAVIPMLFDEWWEDSMASPFRSSRIISKPVEWADPLTGEFLFAIDGKPARCSRKRCRRYHSGCGKDIKQDKTPAKNVPADFRISLDVLQFKPEEISVKATGDCITVEGRHEPKPDGDGYVLNQFLRRFRLPEGHDKAKIRSTLSSDGILTISAPKMALPAPEKERSIPVEQIEKSLEKPTQDEKSNKSNGSSDDKSFTLEDVDE